MRMQVKIFQNLKKRLYLHNLGKGAKFTRGRKWKLVYYKMYNSKNLAMKEEYKLKKNYKLRNKIKKNCECSVTWKTSSDRLGRGFKSKDFDD